jgi:CRP-like cAMP-binding protein
MRNGLLATLPAEDVRFLSPLLERITLAQGDVLFERYQPITHVYFFEEGLSSEIAVNSGPNRIEVGCVGREGLSGIAVVLGVGSSPHRAFMEGGGAALRMQSSDVQKAMEANRNFRTLLLRFAHVFMIQIAATALADGRYGIEQRLARWLLMCQDRLGDELNLTHDFLALMLGVRRPSVTDALHMLEGRRIIRAGRGLITIRDRQKLEEVAANAYGLPEAEYRRLIAST